MPTPFTYEQTTFAGAKSYLAGRVGENNTSYPTNLSRYTDAELGGYVREALLWWGMVSAYYRARGYITLTNDQPFYDTSTITTLPDGTGERLLAESATDHDLINGIEYALVERVTTDFTSYLTTTPYTSLLTPEDMVDVVTYVVNEFLQRTGIKLTRFQQVVVDLPASQIPLPQAVMELRRVGWQTVAGVDSTLLAGDENEFNSLRPDWESDPQPTPTNYTILGRAPLNLTLSPTVSDVGTLDIFSTDSISTISPTTTPVGLSLPDPWVQYIRFGVEAELCARDGELNDPLRATYFRARWEEGVTLAILFSPIINARVNGATPLAITTVDELDLLRPGWMEETHGTPTKVCILGGGWVGLYPVPYHATDPIVVGLDVIRTAPLPVNDGDFIQVGVEHLQWVLDYAEHLALHKIGGKILVQSLPLLRGAIMAGMDYNERLAGKANTLTGILDRLDRELRGEGFPMGGEGDYQGYAEGVLPTVGRINQITQVTS